MVINANKFFCHDNHPYPLSLSLRGKLRLGSNANLYKLPKFEVETAASEESPPVDAQFLDGTDVVHGLSLPIFV